MGNKELPRRPVDRDHFIKVMREKGFTVENLGREPLVNRSGKTIQRELSKGEMQPDLLNRIGKVMDVDPSYLAGDYLRYYDEVKDSLANPELTLYLWTQTNRFPYSKYKAETIDYEEYLLNTLAINNISRKQFLSLDPKKRRAFQFDLGKVLHDVVRQYFLVDSQGIETTISSPDGLTLLIGDWIKDD